MPPTSESHKRLTQPATPPPEPPKVKLPETEAELEERRSNVLAAMWGPKPAAAPEKPTEEAPPAAPAAEVPASDPPPAPAEPEEKKEPETPPAPPAPAAVAPVDTNALIAQTAKKIGEEVGQAIKDSKPEVEPVLEQPVEPDLTPEDIRDSEIISKMEELDPRLKGKADAFKAFAHRRYDYETAWRDKHPGAQFNPDDAEHEDFYKGQPEIDADAFETAKIEVMVDRKVSQRLKPVEERAEAEQRRTKSEQAVSAHTPKIIENVNARIMETVEAVSADVAKLMKDMNPTALTKEQIEKLETEDPIVARVMGPMVMQEMVPMLVELEKSVAPGAEYALDPRNNRVHADIAKFVAKFETAMEAKPERRGGREFITIAELNGKQDEIARSKASAEVKQRKLSELGNRFWTASVDDIQKAIVEDVSKRAKAAVEELDGIARRKYKPEPKKAAANAPAVPPEPTPTPTPATNGKPRPPTVASQATVVDTSRAGKSGEKSFGETAVEVHWGR